MLVLDCAGTIIIQGHIAPLEGKQKVWRKSEKKKKSSRITKLVEKDYTKQHECKEGKGREKRDLERRKIRIDWNKEHKKWETGRNRGVKSPTNLQ